MPPVTTRSRSSSMPSVSGLLNRTPTPGPSGGNVCVAPYLRHLARHDAGGRLVNKHSAGRSSTGPRDLGRKHCEPVTSLRGPNEFHLPCYFGIVSSAQTGDDRVPRALPTVYQHPLAYLLGLEGLALLRAFAGEYDREFTEARLREVSALMESVLRSDEGACAQAMTTADGYRSWAATYDLPANQLIDLEQPLVREILDRLPPGTALDAACGTGRHAAYLASLGHKVIGVDSSMEMLMSARAKVPHGDFRLADLHHLPLPDHRVDVVVCALALTHVPDLLPVLSEFVRVLRQGGHLVISDSRGFFGDITLPLVNTGRRWQPWLHPEPQPSHQRVPVGRPLARARGRQLRRAASWQPTGRRKRHPAHRHRPSDGPRAGAPTQHLGLHSWASAATNAVYRDNPAVIVWHFQTRRR